MKSFTLICALIWSAAAASAATCDSLASFALPDSTITSAQTVAPGEFKQPGGGRETVEDAAGPTFKDLPAFCRVTATLKPSSDSDIKGRSVAAGVRLEPEVSGRGQRRMGGRDQLRCHG